MPNLADWERTRKKMEAAAAGTFWDHLGCTLEAMEERRAVISMKVEPELLNPGGILHGGVSSSLLDTAMGIAAMLLRPQDNLVTSNLNVHFLAPIKQGKVTAIGEVVHQSGRTVTTEGKVLDEEGNLAAYATASFRVI